VLKELYIGRNPSHFQVNPFVKAFIISDSLLWGSWNLITPISAIFVATVIPGGDIQTAAFAFSIYQVARVLFELLSGEILRKSSDRKKLTFTVIGMTILTLAYLGLVFTESPTALYAFYSLTGVGIGLATPAKNSLFALHLDKNREAIEWGQADAVIFICNALAAVVGGYIATKYGFQILFALAAVINLTGIIPYLRFLR
jgi:MFS family permease